MTVKYWAVVPAAGVGRRMASALPKQYLQLRGKSVIEHSLSRLCSYPQISGVVVAINPEDDYWQALELSGYNNVHVADGGAERCHSVLNALQLLGQMADENDWVLVHDAVRPCLHHDDLRQMITELSEHPVGGLLGLPVTDTMKRSRADDSVLETVSREHLWRALTPQMFRLGTLKRALQSAFDDGFLVTDDASAIEHVGLMPRMLTGRGDNIKITRPEDLLLAEMYLAQQEKN